MARYLSVCSGIEAATVAWHPLGWQPLAFSEIEDFPRAVLAHHYPDVPCHGDFTVLRDQPWIVDADVLVGGTPCQAFSVAGLRNSLSDERGNLSLEFVRLADAIDDVRKLADKDPAIIVWENVPGVLSVKDNAFGCFLAGLAGDVEPYVPPRGKWTNAGVVDGPARQVAWRVLDAQYFGLAQRRRRVFVVASARDGFDPAAVLLEFEGVRRDSPPRREAGQGTAHATAPCLTSSGRGVERTGDTRGQDPVVAVKWPAEVTGTLDAHFGDKQGLEDQHVNAGCPLFVPAARDTISTLTARGPYSLGIPEVDGGQIIPTTISALTASMGVGSYLGHNKDDKVIVQPVAHTLKGEGFDASEDGTGRGTPLVPVAYPINTQIALRHKALGERTGLGIGDTNDPAFTLQAGHSHAVAVSQGGGDKPHVLAAIGWDEELNASVEQAGTLLRGGDGGRHNGVMQPNMAVRRLTPVECERLQGFPDGYTNIPWRGKPEAPDGPRYKALGNSMAVPVMRWIGERIANALA